MYLYPLIACANLEKEWFIGYDVALCPVGRCMETRELLRSTRPWLSRWFWRLLCNRRQSRLGLSMIIHETVVTAQAKKKSHSVLHTLTYASSLLVVDLSRKIFQRSTRLDTTNIGELSVSAPSLNDPAYFESHLGCSRNSYHRANSLALFVPRPELPLLPYFPVHPLPRPTEQQRRTTQQRRNPIHTRPLLLLELVRHTRGPLLLLSLLVFRSRGPRLVALRLH